jgi:hypothetical protein
MSIKEKYLIQSRLVCFPSPCTTASYLTVHRYLQIRNNLSIMTANHTLAIRETNTSTPGRTESSLSTTSDESPPRLRFNPRPSAKTRFSCFPTHTSKPCSITTNHALSTCLPSANQELPKRVGPTQSLTTELRLPASCTSMPQGRQVRRWRSLVFSQKAGNRVVPPLDHSRPQQHGPFVYICHGCRGPSGSP